MTKKVSQFMEFLGEMVINMRYFYSVLMRCLRFVGDTICHPTFPKCKKAVFTFLNVKRIPRGTKAVAVLPSSYILHYPHSRPNLREGTNVKAINK